MIIDGRTIAKEILTNVRTQSTSKVTVRAITVVPSPATRSYLSIKKARAEDAGMTLEVVELGEGATTKDVIQAVEKDGADAVIVQLPLPAHVDVMRVLNVIPEDKDADILSEKAYEGFERSEQDALVPPVAQAVLEILKRSGVEVFKKNVVVAGRGQLVGKPVATLLSHLGARVTVVHSSTENSMDVFKVADIIVSGVGKAHFITPNMVKEGVVLIDAGTSESNGVVVGDVDPECAEVASLFTPVPGGVGPVAVACLFKNVATLVSQKKK